VVHRGPQGFLAAVVVAAFVASVLIGDARFARNTPPLTTISDIAVIELYTGSPPRGREAPEMRGVDSALECRITPRLKDKGRV
jgi:hypothetical protein